MNDPIQPGDIVTYQGGKYRVSAETSDELLLKPTWGTQGEPIQAKRCECARVNAEDARDSDRKYR